MTNYEIDRDNKIDAIGKKLDALIEALGYDIGTVNTLVPVDGGLIKSRLIVDYKLTKREGADNEQ